MSLDPGSNVSKESLKVTLNPGGILQSTLAVEVQYLDRSNLEKLMTIEYFSPGEGTGYLDEMKFRVI